MQDGLIGINIGFRRLYQIFFYVWTTIHIYQMWTVFTWKWYGSDTCKEKSWGNILQTACAPQETTEWLNFSNNMMKVLQSKTHSQKRHFCLESPTIAELRRIL